MTVNDTIPAVLREEYRTLPEAPIDLDAIVRRGRRRRRARSAGGAGILVAASVAGALAIGWALPGAGPGPGESVAVPGDSTSGPSVGCLDRPRACEPVIRDWLSSEGFDGQGAHFEVHPAYAPGNWSVTVERTTGNKDITTLVQVVVDPVRAETTAGFEDTPRDRTLRLSDGSRVRVTDIAGAQHLVFWRLPAVTGVRDAVVVTVNASDLSRAGSNTTTPLPPGLDDAGVRALLDALVGTG
jgi:hypothetical protein